MKRKKYEVPTMDVVKLEQTCQILAGSVEATRSGYGDAEEFDWE